MSTFVFGLFLVWALVHICFAVHVEEQTLNKESIRGEQPLDFANLHVLFDNLLTVERKKKAEAKFHLQHGIRKYESVPVKKDLVHKVIFAVKQRNTHQLHDVLMSVSDPKSPKYGKHWSREKVGAFTRNKRAARSIQKTLAHHGITVDTVTLYDEYITAHATIDKWESFFQTKFYHFHDEVNDKLVVRATSHALPLPLDPLVSGVFGVSDYFLDRSRDSRQRAKSVLREMLESYEMDLAEVPKVQSGPPFPPYGNNGDPWCVYPEIGPGENVQFCLVYPQLLYKYYNSSSPYGNGMASQAVFASLDQSFSPADLSHFQEVFNLTVKPITGAYNGHVFYNACITDYGSNCDEASLDVQYITAMAQNVSTYFDYVGNWNQGADDLFYDWILTVVNMTNPAAVFSVSYGGYEAYSDTDTMMSFNTEAMKLGIQGVTIIVSSGDDGAVGSMAMEGYCYYYPSFPSVSAYVTSVGATQGPEEGKPEVTCQVPASMITSGGGFSAATTPYINSEGFYTYVPVNPVPYWQATNVKNYLLKEPDLAPGFGSGRGYPDISMMGNNYFVAINGSFEPLSGTSASAPVFAGVVSQANSVLKAQGKSTLGFLNPLLYQYADLFVHDITKGANNCSSAYNTSISHGTLVFEGFCCEEGFVATRGWDPVTGLGSLDVDRFVTVATSFLVTVAPTMSPTNAPTPTALVSVVQGPKNVEIDFFALDGTGDYIVGGSNISPNIYGANASSTAAFANIKWKALMSIKYNYMYYSVAMDMNETNIVACASGMVFYSRNGGISWNSSVLPPLVYYFKLSQIANSVDNRVIMISDGYSSASISYDYGATFTSTVVVGGSSNNVVGLAVSSTGNTLVIGTYNFVNCSNDGGVTWHGGNGITEYGYHSYSNLLVSDDLILVAGNYGTMLFASTDGGYNFDVRYSSPGTEFTMMSSDASLNRIVAIDSFGSDMMVSTNRGFNFEPLIIGPYAQPVFSSDSFFLQTMKVDRENATTMIFNTAFGEIFRGTLVWNYVATEVPSVSPTVSPTQTLVPSVVPTAALTSSRPSVAPTTSSPSFTPTTSSPSVNPTPAPTAAPTTSSPSFNPTPAPTAAPTTQSFPILSFPAYLTLSQVYVTLESGNTYTLSPEQSQSIAEAAATSMSLAADAVTVTTYTVVVAASAQKQHLQQSQVLASQVQVNMSTAVLVLPGQDSQVLYTTLSSSLATAVSDGTYIGFLTTYAQEEGVTDTFTQTSAQTVEFGSPTTSSTASQPSTKKKNNVAGVIAGSVVGGAIGLCILMVCVFYLGYMMGSGKSQGMATRNEDNAFTVNNPTFNDKL